jgi:hypothetical protein
MKKFKISTVAAIAVYAMLAVVTHLVWMSALGLCVYYMTKNDDTGAVSVLVMLIIGYGGILSYYAVNKIARK